jgi:hypothetical protein
LINTVRCSICTLQHISLYIVHKEETAFVTDTHNETAFVTDTHIETAFVTDTHNETAFVTDTHNETPVTMCTSFLVVSLEVSTAVLLMFQIITNVMLCH